MASSGDTMSAVPPLRALRRSALACTRCRQQKMKCSGGSPPCDRCRKANSHCTFEAPHPPPPLPPTHSLTITATAAEASASMGAPNMPMIQPLAAFPILPPPHNASSGFYEHCSASSNTSASSQRPLSPQLRTAPHSHSAVFALQEMSPGHGFGPSPPESTAESLRSKRRRVSVEPSGDTDIDAEHPGFASETRDTSSPYQTVQAFESAFRQDSYNKNGSSAARHGAMAQNSLEYHVMFPQSTTDRGPLLHYLCEAGLELEDARDMFVLFGQRVGPFLPWLYDTDFTDLPNDPLYALAGIEVMARYLPGVSGLKAKLDSILQSLVRHVLFDDLSRSYEAVLETMRGLAIIYSYSKVGVAQSQSRCKTEQSRADVLSMKGVIEGYAVRWNIGRPHASNVLGCVLWLWLYTMSSYYSLLLACPKTLSADQRIHKAKSIVKNSTSHPQIAILLGEVDLCCVTEPHNSAIDISSAPDNLPQFDDWINIWAPLESTATAGGRRLRFHFRFAQFYQHSRRSKPQTASAEVLGAARAFLHCMTRTSPVSKGRIRYMCDFGFVMLVSACCYILKALETSRAELASLLVASVQDVREVADLLKSLLSQEATTGAYGRALEGACDALSRRRSILSPSKGRRDVGEEQEVSSSQPVRDAFSHVDGGNAETAHLGQDAAHDGTLSLGFLDSTGQQSQRPDGDITSASAVFGDEQISWFGSITDIPGGLLLDALSAPWQS